MFGSLGPSVVDKSKSSLECCHTQTAFISMNHLEQELRNFLSFYIYSPKMPSEVWLEHS